jgi:ribosomal protein S18 acetylase RimI-like enzyme
MSDQEYNYIHALLFANELVSSQRTILCFHENELAGLVCWGVRGLLENGVCEISYLVVRPSFRRQTAGKQLVGEVINIAIHYFEERGLQLRRVFSFMKKENTIGHSFFKSIGFVRASEIQSFYPDDDAVIWIKHL